MNKKIIARGITGLALLMGLGYCGTNYYHKHHPKTVELKKEVKPVHDLEKKIFMYTQRVRYNDKDNKINNIALKKEKAASNVVDYFLPHHYDLDGDYKTVIVNKKKKEVLKDQSNIRLKKANGMTPKDISDFIDRNPSQYITPMIGVFNDEVIRKVLDDPKKYSRIVADMVKKEGYQGVSMDFESTAVGGECSEKLIRFMEYLRVELPKDKYTLSVAVSPRFQGSGTKKSFPHHAFYDYKGLSPYVDYIHIMSYDFHKGIKNNPPCPILPNSKLEKIMDYALGEIPREQIVVLLPYYGAEWTPIKEKKSKKHGKKNDKTQKIIKYKRPKAINAATVERKSNNSIIKDTYIDGELYLEFKDGRIIYGQDKDSFNQRLQLLNDRGINYTGGWRLSHGTNEFFDQYKSWKKE